MANSSCSLYAATQLVLIQALGQFDVGTEGVGEERNCDAPRLNFPIGHVEGNTP